MIPERFALALLVACTVAAMATPALTETAPPLLPDETGLLFGIGTQDQRRTEFKSSGWRAVRTHACTVGLDCDAARFPTRLVAASAADHFATTSVERVVISFTLAEPVAGLSLSVARFGSEKSMVRFDDGPPVTVTREMMAPPSAEDIWGRFELPLGPASAGMHRIELSVLDDGTGTGRHSLDAIAVTVVRPAP